MATDKIEAQKERINELEHVLRVALRHMAVSPQNINLTPGDKVIIKRIEEALNDN